MKTATKTFRELNIHIAAYNAEGSRIDCGCPISELDADPAGGVLGQAEAVGLEFFNDNTDGVALEITIFADEDDTGGRSVWYSYDRENDRLIVKQ